jgi:transposase
MVLDGAKLLALPSWRFAGMSYFAQPILGRNQRVLIPTTLDDAVSDDHEVRILEEILRAMDWSDWVDEYCQVRGQPPIHPRILAALILYGMARRIRSSRVLEYMTGHNIDFMWLTEGRKIDHTTICKFRTRFKKQLRELFRQVGRMALNIGLIRLGEVTFDGTRVKANNDRYETWTAGEVEKQLAALVERFGQWLEEAETTDSTEDESFGLSSPEALPPHLADAKTRYERLKTAQQQLQAAEAARRKDGIDPTKNPAQLPSTDPDAKVMPNKEGGYAPNYTPLTAVDTHSDFIVYADVIPDVAENTHTVAMVDQVREDFGTQPQVVLADGHHATGPNIEAMQQRGVEFFSPLAGETSTSNPADREDPTQPVPEAAWSMLPINPQTKKLDKACFVYNEQENQYYCPLGHTLEFEKTKPDVRQGQKITLQVYRCHACEGCPLAGLCVSEKNQGGRTITRDIYTKTREQHAAKMQTPEARERYQRRFHAGETPFGWLKQTLGLRQFLLRGLEKVRTEWLWACTAHNVKKLVTEVGRLRAKVTGPLVVVEG